jgi:hypothetical protein
MRVLGRLSPRDSRALLLGLAFLVPAFLVVLVARPYRAAVTDAQERLAAERDLLARELELVASGPALPAMLERALATATVSDLRLVEGANGVLAEAELTDLVEAWAIRSRVLLEDIRSVEPPRGEEAPLGLSAVRLSVSGESDLEGVMSFLNGIESGSILVRVRGLALEPVMAEARPTGVVEFQMVVEGYARLADVEQSEPNAA